MPLFVIERTFADQLELDADGVKGTLDYNEENELKWLFSFLSADKKRTYCLYEAEDAAALITQAEALGIPADEVVEVGEINPQAFFGGETVTGHDARS